MAGSTFGTIFKITTWGESHGAGIGVVIDGCPAGLPLSEDDIQQFLNLDFFFLLVLSDLSFRILLTPHFL